MSFSLGWSPVLLCIPNAHPGKTPYLGVDLYLGKRFLRLEFALITGHSGNEFFVPIRIARETVDYPSWGPLRHTI